MTSFHSPDRPRLANGAPAWFGVQVALPAIYVLPVEGLPELIDVGLMLDSSWKRCRICVDGLPNLLKEWQADPEQTLRNWFDCEPPVARQTVRQTMPVQQSEAEHVGSATQSAEDLDL